MPSYPGGLGELSSFIIENLSDSIKKSELSGKILMSMVVDKSGAIKNAKVLKGINDSFDKEILRIFAIMPKWIPAVENGKKVEREFAFPFKIDLRKEK